ncbi:glycosyltransferase [Bacteroidetes/Chlorobi group bacterium MS-B_bin-24]|nr:MAG: glycosyltransferase [Bacteroidetes/Chlorobi group bacterium MS-B_bin-24]
MKRVLIIAYYFPPSGGPGVQRVLKYTKYLAEFGWEPFVLTVENGTFPAVDYSLLDEIPEKVKVFRTKIFEPYDLYRIFTGKPKNVAIDVNVIKKEDQKLSFKEKVAEFIRATFFIPDARVGWLLTAKSKAIQICRQYEIDAIYSSSPPYTCSLIARYTKRKMRIPWIAGFRDPWTGFISAPQRWFLPAKIDKHLEFSVFAEADLVEVAWEGIAKDALSKYPQLPREKFIHIPNGFDPADFPNIEYRLNPIFTLTYTGSMYGRRNPQSLFVALEWLISQNLLNPEKIKIKLIGRFGNEIYEMIEKTKIKDRIEIIGYLPHSKSLEHLLTSDALLLIVDESKESEEIVPGKVFEYLGTRRPVLAIAPTNGAVAKIIAETKSGLVAHQSEPEKIAQNFLELFKAWENNTNFQPNWYEIQKYNRKEHAKILSELLNKLTQGNF